MKATKKGVREMWISKKRFRSLEEKIADLEVRVQSQQKILLLHIQEHEKSVSERKEIIASLNNTYIG